MHGVINEQHNDNTRKICLSLKHSPPPPLYPPSLGIRESMIYEVTLYLPPIIVGFREEEQHLPLLHPDLLALLGDILEVIADHHKDVPTLQPHAHPPHSKHHQ